MDQTWPLKVCLYRLASGFLNALIAVHVPHSHLPFPSLSLYPAQPISLIWRLRQGEEGKEVPFPFHKLTSEILRAQFRALVPML